MDSFLQPILEGLGQADQLESIVAYLQTEWIKNPEDMEEIIKNEEVWSTLKLPARLKVELSKLFKYNSKEEGKYNLFCYKRFILIICSFIFSFCFKGSSFGPGVD